MITWVVGAGGLFGSAIVRQADDLFQSKKIHWQSHEQALRDLTQNAQQFRAAAGDEDWAVLWAAGNASTSSSALETGRELESLTALVDALVEYQPSGRGVFFLTSSAGGVYAGSSNPPFSTLTLPLPLSPYGELKLAQEHVVSNRLLGVCDVVIGRVANLYGPGQNLEKLQGLLSRLALSSITKTPLSIFVSLDTMRDYIYSDDAARIALHWIRKYSGMKTNTPQIKIIASGQPVSIGYLIHLMQDIARTKTPISYGSHSSSAAQARDLRLMPSGQEEVEGFLQTPLPAGTKSIYLDILDRYQTA